MAHVSSISLITKLFPRQKDKVLSAMYLGATAGNVLGLALGSLIFEYLGYLMLFASQSLLIFIAVFLILFFEDDRATESYTPNTPRSLGFAQLILIRRVFAGLLNFGISLTLFFFLEPTLALKLN